MTAGLILLSLFLAAGWACSALHFRKRITLLEKQVKNGFDMLVEEKANTSKRIKNIREHYEEHIRLRDAANHLKVWEKTEAEA